MIAITSSEIKDITERVKVTRDGLVEGDLLIYLGFEYKKKRYFKEVILGKEMLLEKDRNKLGKLIATNISLDVVQMLNH